LEVGAGSTLLFFHLYHCHNISLILMLYFRREAQNQLQRVLILRVAYTHTHTHTHPALSDLIPMLLQVENQPGNELPAWVQSYSCLGALTEAWFYLFLGVHGLLFVPLAPLVAMVAWFIWFSWFPSLPGSCLYPWLQREPWTPKEPYKLKAHPLMQ